MFALIYFGVVLKPNLQSFYLFILATIHLFQIPFFFFSFFSFFAFLSPSLLLIVYGKLHIRLAVYLIDLMK